MGVIYWAGEERVNGGQELSRAMEKEQGFGGGEEKRPKGIF